MTQSIPSLYLPAARYWFRSKLSASLAQINSSSFKYSLLFAVFVVLSVNAEIKMYIFAEEKM